MDTAEKLLLELDENQREVATSFGAPICVLAGAGTGKTRAITYRIAYGVKKGYYRPDMVLALTFTTKAAFEMKERLAKLGVKQVQARTFHSAALKQLAYFWPQVMGYELPKLIDNKISLVSIVSVDLGHGSDKSVLRDLASEIEWAKVSIVAPSHYAQYVRSINRVIPAGLTPEQMQVVYENYEKVKVQRGVIDFDDVLILLIGLLKNYPNVLETITSQYRYFIVDEYQDVSLLQQTLLDLWLNGRPNICVVGDVAQTIYSFAGADPNFLINFCNRYENARKIVLNKNYRCAKSVVELANKVISNATHNNSKLTTVFLRSMSESDTQVEFDVYLDEKTEAMQVTNTISNLISQGVEPKDIAVLFRTNAQSQHYESQMSEQNIPYLLRGGSKFFERSEIKDALRAMQKTILTDPQLDSYEVVNTVIESLGYSPDASSLTGAMKEKWDNLNALRDLCIANRNITSTIGEFYNYLVDMVNNQSSPQVNAVTLSTLHACKGLEWDYVFIVNLNEGSIPFIMAQTQQQIEEEHRLLYVGVTRARKKLFISRNSQKGGGSQTLVSRFLKDLWKHKFEKVNLAYNKITAKDKDMVKQAINSDDDATYLYKLLKAWRVEKSQEEGVLEYKILTESTMGILSIVQPETMQELRKIRGIGVVKAEKYGSEILDVIKQVSGD